MRPMHISVHPATGDPMTGDPMTGDPAIGERSVRIVVTGELDLATLAELRSELDAVLSRRPILIEVDLSAVTFFSCAAAQALRDAQLRAPEALIVVGAGRPIRRLLQIMRLQPLLAPAA